MFVIYHEEEEYQDDGHYEEHLQDGSERAFLVRLLRRVRGQVLAACLGRVQHAVADIFEDVGGLELAHVALVVDEHAGVVGEARGALELHLLVEQRVALVDAGGVALEVEGGVEAVANPLGVDVEVLYDLLTALAVLRWVQTLAVEGALTS